VRNLEILFKEIRDKGGGEAGYDFGWRRRIKTFLKLSSICNLNKIKKGIFCAIEKNYPKDKQIGRGNIAVLESRNKPKNR
jgi:hypothetical protein